MEDDFYMVEDLKEFRLKNHVQDKVDNAKPMTLFKAKFNGEFVVDVNEVCDKTGDLK